jgi:regulator of sirC expression with transglutaminase-like and TPR domain
VLMHVAKSVASYSSSSKTHAKCTSACGVSIDLMTCEVHPWPFHGKGVIYAQLRCFEHAIRTLKANGKAIPVTTA